MRLRLIFVKVKTVRQQQKAVKAGFHDIKKNLQEKLAFAYEI
jgi:chaperonin cofactor prefoldin